ncbi:hypothetical protein Tco_0651076 [Tanacetum coccineum]
MDYQCTQPSEEIDKIIQRTQERGIEICRQNEELNRVHEETMQILRELIKVQDEKRIAKEKEAAELEAKRKSQECLNIEEKSIPQASIRSPKFDYLLEEFSGELAHTDPIPPGVVDIDSEPEEEICLAENLSYDNSSPRPPEECNSEIADTIVESLSPPPIPIEDSDFLMEEIDLFLASDDSMPPGIEIDDYDSEGDIRFLEELLNSDSPPLPENESFSLDHFVDPSLPHPPPEPPDAEICFNFEPDAGIVTKKVVGDISKHDVLMPNLLPTQPTLCPVFDLLLPFSSENEDKLFKPGIFSSPFLSHWAKITFDFSESPMMIFGGDIPHLYVTYLHFYPP